MSEPCSLESEVVRAAAEERWTAELREHLGSCADCSAAVAVAPWMGRFARLGDRERPLPDPSLVWLKAQLLRGSADASRATRPLNIAQLIAYLGVAGGWAAMLTWKWAALETWMRSFTPTGLVSTATGVETLSLSFFATLVALATVTIMVAMHTIMAEE